MDDEKQKTIKNNSKGDALNESSIQESKKRRKQLIIQGTVKEKKKKHTTEPILKTKAEYKFARKSKRAGITMGYERTEDLSIASDKDYWL